MCRLSACLHGKSTNGIRYGLVYRKLVAINLPIRGMVYKQTIIGLVDDTAKCVHYFGVNYGFYVEALWFGFALLNSKDVILLDKS